MKMKKNENLSQMDREDENVRTELGGFVGIAITVALTVLASTYLAGCGRKEVNYTLPDDLIIAAENSNGSQENDDAVSSKAVSTESIRAKVGIGEEIKWKDDVGSGENHAKIAAYYSIPDANEMYNIKCKEHYYSPEEKKAIIDYLFDKGSVRVDINRTPSREWASRRIAICEQGMQFYGDRETDTRMYYGYAELCEQIRDYYQNRIDELPYAEEISTELGDYSAGHYIGTRDGIPYTLDFISDSEGNISEWIFRADKLSDLVPDVVEPKYPQEGIGFYTGYTSNECTMTTEEAAQQAEEICDGLGLDYMTVFTNLSMAYEPVDLDESGSYKLFGYFILMGREYESTQISPIWHYCDTEIEENAQPYARERVLVEINDNGIVQMVCSSPLELVEEPEPTELLKFMDVSDKLAELASKASSGIGTEWGDLALEYARIPSGEADTYIYVPAWRLSMKMYSDQVADQVHNSVWVNAVTGEEIKPMDNGDFDYNMPEYYLYNISVED